jgi:hypothetical protein
MTHRERELIRITDQLLRLSQKSLKSELSMEHAELLSEVKDRQLYLASFNTFTDFCSSMGYHETTIYALIRIWKHDLLRESYPDIGPRRATDILNATKELGDSLVPALIEFAKENTRVNLVNRIEEIKELKKIVESDLDSLEIEESHYYEGGRKEHLSSFFERNPEIRFAAISIHGTKCMGCGFDFEEKYGERGSGFIEVHHLRSVNQLTEPTEIDPRTDMIVVCSNCHRMIHRKRNDPLSLKELRRIIKS